MNWLPFLSRSMAAAEARALRAETLLVERDRQLADAAAQAAFWRGRFEGIVDNALFNSGLPPVFDPGAPRFKPPEPPDPAAPSHTISPRAARAEAQAAQIAEDIREYERRKPA